LLGQCCPFRHGGLRPDAIFQVEIDSVQR
jgi:hypothetical protein